MVVSSIILLDVVTSEEDIVSTSDLEEDAFPLANGNVEGLLVVLMTI